MCGGWQIKEDTMRVLVKPKKKVHGEDERLDKSLVRGYCEDNRCGSDGCGTRDQVDDLDDILF